jgi:hypothetical protein
VGSRMSSGPSLSLALATHNSVKRKMGGGGGAGGGEIFFFVVNKKWGLIDAALW